jgi:hypothetical protein
MNETALVVSAASRANFILNRYRKPVAPIENEAQFHSQQELCMRISPLRQRMPGDKNLAAFIGRPPETATGGGFAALPSPSCSEPAWRCQCELVSDRA